MMPKWMAQRSAQGGICVEEVGLYQPQKWAVASYGPFEASSYAQARWLALTRFEEVAANAEKHA